MKLMDLRGLALGLCVGALGLALDAGAITITGTASGGRSATADLSLSGNVLTVDLKNTGSAAQVPADVLIGLFFSLPSGVSIGSGSAALGSGSSVAYGSIINNVGEGWSFANGISAHGQTAGISAAGLGIFGAPNLYSIPVLPLNGLDYGIANGFNSPNTGITGHGPIISNEIDFKLNLSGTIDLASLGNSFVFQWGTALDEGSGGPGVPDGGTTVALLGLSLAGLGWFGRRQKASL